MSAFISSTKIYEWTFGQSDVKADVQFILYLCLVKKGNILVSKKCGKSILCNLYLAQVYQRFN